MAPHQHQRSCLWLLEAKPFAEEDRSAAASSVKFWLAGPHAALVVGRAGPHTDLAVEEDKSISRKHAEITVVPADQWGEQDEEPYILVKGEPGGDGGGGGCHQTGPLDEFRVAHTHTGILPVIHPCFLDVPLPPSPALATSDHSKYGTTCSSTGEFSGAPLGAGQTARLAAGQWVRFGYKSPFKLYHQASSRLHSRCAGQRWQLDAACLMFAGGWTQSAAAPPRSKPTLVPPRHPFSCYCCTAAVPSHRTGCCT